MTTSGFHYPSLVQEALRGVVRLALEQVAAEGLPGDHYFYISFRTGAPGVELPGALRDLYPEEMTVVLQHQFWDLEVSVEAFSVVLAFGGRKQRITVPFTAVTAFIDPTAEFGLRFEGSPPTGEGDPTESPVSPGEEAPAKPAGPANVISMDDFRKK